jgi:hypothetical protein
VTKAARAEMYRSFLNMEGYLPKIDEDGDVTFKHEGKHYFIAVSEKDDEFFRLVFPAFWAIESETEREQATRAALQATADTKVAKVFVNRDDTWASIEMFCSPPEAFKPVFQRSLRALAAGVDAFRRKMQE